MKCIEWESNITHAADAGCNINKHLTKVEVAINTHLEGTVLGHIIILYNDKG